MGEKSITINVNTEAWKEIKRLLTNNSVLTGRDLTNPKTSIILLRIIQEVITKKKTEEPNIKVSFTKEY